MKITGKSTVPGGLNPKAVLIAPMKGALSKFGVVVFDTMPSSSADITPKPICAAVGEPPPPETGHVAKPPVVFGAIPKAVNAPELMLVRGAKETIISPSSVCRVGALMPPGTPVTIFVLFSFCSCAGVICAKAGAQSDNHETRNAISLLIRAFLLI